MSDPIQPDFSPESRARLRRVWRGIKNRCFNPNNPRFATHGGRGIWMHPPWLNDFRAFRAWALTNGFKPGLAINRIDKRKGFTPDNCRAQSLVSQSLRYAGPALRRATFRKPQRGRAGDPAQQPYGIGLVCKGDKRQKTCGGFIWR